MERYKQCILATCPVPWDENYNFAEDIFRNQIKHILQHGTKHIYIFGTAGEGYAVNDSQFKQITETFYEEMKAGSSDPMVGIISMSLPTVIERIKWSYELGVRSFQLSLPAWGACNFDEIRKFFAETCGRFSDCSFLHYNCPRSKRMITVEEYAKLASQFPNLTATKNAVNTAADMILLFQKTPGIRHFLTEFNFSVAALLGLDPGLLISIASVNWATANRFFASAVEGDIQTLNSYIKELTQIHCKLLEIIGPSFHMDGAYDKLFSKIADERFPLRLLPPYQNTEDNSFYVFKKYIQQNFSGWVISNQR
jgi:dihydrodipicolinate synthase/N-acetylneuraminate lyase